MDSHGFVYFSTIIASHNNMETAYCGFFYQNFSLLKRSNITFHGRSIFRNVTLLNILFHDMITYYITYTQQTSDYIDYYRVYSIQFHESKSALLIWITPSKLHLNKKRTVDKALQLYGKCMPNNKKPQQPC